MIRILLFAQLQETIGESELRVHLTDHTVGQIKVWMENKYPMLSIEEMMVAVNEEFATDEVILKAGDTLAFIPPISGG